MRMIYYSKFVIFSNYSYFRFFLGGYDNFPKLFESLCFLTIKQRNENRLGHFKQKKKKETLSIVCGFDFDRTLAPNP